MVREVPNTTLNCTVFSAMGLEDRGEHTILQPTDPNFGKVAAIWYKHIKKVYGIRGSHFGGDLFHEGGNQGGTPLKEAAEAVLMELMELWEAAQL